MHSTNITKDFNGLPIVFRADGYISVTKVIQQFPGKRIANFVRLDSTAEYLEVLRQYLGSESLVVTKRGGRKGESGTWYHPKLAVFFARWLDVRFAVWCDLMIDNILQGNIQTSVAVPTKEAVAVQAVGEEMKLENLRLKEENAALKADVVRLQESGLKTGEIPRGWLTAWTYLEDQGHGYPFIRAAVKDFGMLCASFCKRLVDEEGDGYSPISRKGKQGSKESDYTYYHPDILKGAYKKLLKMYEMSI